MFFFRPSSDLYTIFRFFTFETEDEVVLVLFYFHDGVYFVAVDVIGAQQKEEIALYIADAKNPVSDNTKASGAVIAPRKP